MSIGSRAVRNALKASSANFDGLVKYFMDCLQSGNPPKLSEVRFFNVQILKQKMKHCMYLE